MDAIKLTKGAITVLSSGQLPLRSDFKPSLQIADIRLVMNQNQKAERYRILLSDGEFVQQGILVTELNELIKSEKLRKGSVVKLRQFICSEIMNRKIIIVLNLDVIIQKCHPIGRPKQFPVLNQVSASSATSPPSPTIKVDVDVDDATHEQSLSAARKQVFGIVDRICGLSLQEKLLVANILVNNTNELELFSSLPAVARAEYVRMMLAGEF